MNGEVVHGSGGVVAVLSAAGCVVMLIAAKRRESRARRRARALLRQAPEPRCGQAHFWRRASCWAAPLGAAGLGFLIGGLAGGAVGIAAAFCVRRWQRGRDRPEGAGGAETGEHGEAAGQLALAADLMAACISAGASPREAAEAVGESLGGPVGARLARTAAQLRLGAETAPAWRWFGGIPGAKPLARCLERADSTGAPAAEPVARLAERLRAERARAVARRGRRAQVLITAPVGLCFLPAFLAVGVAPVVIGLAGGLLRGH
ncbi:type II secretion system F family protein [Streptomyces xantholiticus]|uniref:type II secretion system F family protein n=1 Tax=Streptomyces xantholiticus TaxID=68285 RepID=UPI0016776DE1|nr:type II secretion system F family protein [Streptomyces xantholiticus]GGW55359.1 membrane protein [Streptomyces xantholiticus]